jgi:hypothetical protein
MLCGCERLFWVLPRFLHKRRPNSGKCLLVWRYGKKVVICFVVVLVACDCPRAGCANTSRECVFLLRQKMEETYQKSLSSDAVTAKQAKTDLQNLSQHSMDLTTNLLSFGGDQYGIFSAHPVDLMHCFLEGIVKYAVSTIFSCVRRNCRESSFLFLINHY